MKMPNEANWTTVSGKSKGKVTTSSLKAPTVTGNTNISMPTAEVKSIKLSESTFSAMKNRIEDDDSDHGPSAPTKPSVSSQEKVLPSNIPKLTNGKSSSNNLTLKQAIQNINLNKLVELIASSKDNRSLLSEKVCYWFVEQLKNVTSGLQDPIFSKETDAEYPINGLASKVRERFDQVFSDSESKLKGISLCQNGLLQPNIDVNVAGAYQILLQYFFRRIDENDLAVLMDDLDHFAASLKRYPSDKVLRLLWAFSQIQYSQPAYALKIWFCLMFPLVENRTYNSFVIGSISQLTSRNGKNKKFLSSNELFTIESYLKLLEFVDRPNPALTKELRASLLTSATILSELFCLNEKNLKSFGNAYFKNLFPVLNGDKNRTSKTQTIIERMIVAAMIDESCGQAWLDSHQRTPASSATLLSLVQNNEKAISYLSSTKEIRTLIERLRTISTKHRGQKEHDEFLDDYGKNEKIKTINRRSKSKFNKFSIVKLLIFVLVSFLVYRNWLWLTVATDYLLEDYLKHPTAIVIKENLIVTREKLKYFIDVSMKHIEEYSLRTKTQLEPWINRSAEYCQTQWRLFLKYVEGPVYEKSIEIAEEIQKFSMITFNKSVYYLNIFFENASVQTAKLVDLMDVYAREIYALAYDQWMKFDGQKLKEKFDALKLRVVKSI